tara:strand:- start:49 stop:243 length:195 start_codon:yes stop_codon:yes gene_type:complete
MIEISNIKTAKYYKDSISNQNVSINVTLTNNDNIMYCVPMDENNVDYQVILSWVSEGNTIESAD